MCLVQTRKPWWFFSYYSYFPESLNILCVLLLHMEQHVHTIRSKDICEGPKRKQKQRKALTGRIKPLFRGFQALLGLACLPVQWNSFITGKDVLPASLFSLQLLLILSCLPAMPRTSWYHSQTGPPQFGGIDWEPVWDILLWKASLTTRGSAEPELPGSCTLSVFYLQSQKPNC